MACAVQEDRDEWERDIPFIAMTTLGGSYLKYAPIVMKSLEKQGFEVAIFHSASMQGAIMERLIEVGKMDGLLDLCPQELLTEYCGGSICSPGRMTAAARKGIPQIVGPGGLGVFPWGSLEQIPKRFKDRVIRAHNEILSGIQASTKEMIEVARIMADKLNRSIGPVAVVVPEKGFFEYDRPGEVFYNPEGRNAFIETLQECLRTGTDFTLMDCHINDREYAEKVAEIALTLFRRR
jgi:uncharacterized protein (UPF0261 family)